MIDNRLPAEWEPQHAILLAWPHDNTDWAYMLEQVRDCYCEIIQSLSTNNIKVILIGPDPQKIVQELNPNLKKYIDNKSLSIISIETNDTWARDFGPISVFGADGKVYINDFKFNGWGLKFASSYDNLINRQLYTSCLAKYGEYINRLGFVLEGGSIDSDGHGTILTTSECLLSPNRNGDLTRDQISDKLNMFFGSKRVLWLDHGALEGDDTDSHIDTLARFVDTDTIVYCGAGDIQDAQYAGLKAMAKQLKEFTTDEGLPYNLVELPLPDPIYDDDGFRLPATYVNFLITNGIVLLPVYNQPQKDTLARLQLQSLFTNRRVIPIDCTALIKQHGSLHCITMQLPSHNM